MKKVALVVGTRPEVIKMAPVFKELKKSETLAPILLSTGQHKEMLQQAFDAFELTPDIDLKLMHPGQTLPDLTSRVLLSVTEFIKENSPDAILVQGDTATVLATSIAAAFAQVPLGHVEAGLRTYNMMHPFPEEMNRRLTSPIARWSFVPTEQSRQNLLSERIPAELIHVTGNSVIDSLLWMRDRVKQSTISSADKAISIGISSKFYQDRMVDGKRWILVTGHRRESFGGGFLSICEALLELTKKYPDIGILYPVHLNPNVREPVNRLLTNNPQIELIEPVGYENFVWLMDQCYFIVSDSGGVQEEAPSLGKPVLVMRETTERPEGIDAGTCRLVGTDKVKILAECDLLLKDKDSYVQRCQLRNPYGDGTTSAQIRKILEADLCQG